MPGDKVLPIAEQTGAVPYDIPCVEMSHGAAAAKYIDAFFQNIQWEAVAARIEALPKVLP